MAYILTKIVLFCPLISVFNSFFPFQNVHSYDGIRKTVTVMRYMKAAVKKSKEGVKGQNTAKKILKLTLPKVNTLGESYTKLAQKTAELMKKSEEGVITVANEDKEMRMRWNKWKSDVQKMEAELAQYRAEDLKYKTIVKLQKKILEEIAVCHVFGM